MCIRDRSHIDQNNSCNVTDKFIWRNFIGNPIIDLQSDIDTVSYTHLDVYKRQEYIRQTIPDWKDYIERLSGYMASTGKQYQNLSLIHI